MDESRTPTALLCPGCGKPVDPLRAGQVAILEGGFRYFCDAGCKSAYVDSSRKRPALEALTAEPPLVRPARPAEAEVLAVGTYATANEEPSRFALPAATEEESDEPEAVDAAVCSLPLVAKVSEARKVDRCLLDEPSLPKAPAEQSRSAAHGASALPLIGAAFGGFSVVVSLVGEAGSRLRLPLALVASAVVVAQAVRRRRDESELAPWLVAGPVIVAAVGAVLSAVLRDSGAGSHAAYLGLAAAGVLFVDWMIVRARRDVVHARSHVAAALATRARVVRSEATEDVDAARVTPGESIVAEAGDVIGVDGIVVAGEAEVAPWLDSSVVLVKREGDAVVAGASVLSGRLRVTATFVGPDRAWLKPGRSSSRLDVAAPLVRVVRTVAGRGVPIAALLVGWAAYANGGGLADVVIAVSAGGYAVLGFAAVATAALAHARGRIAAQRRGIVYKDADAFDAAARADVAVVCSRGTILLGEPELVAVEAVSGRDSNGRTTEDGDEAARVLSLAAGAEVAAGDVFGTAIARAARARAVRPEGLRSAIVHAGLGVSALGPSGDNVLFGSRAFLLREKVSVAIADARITELEAQGRSVLLVALGDRLVGLLALQDGLRPGARALMQRLHDSHIEPVLLSGEARDTCETIARALDVDHVRPEILPSERGAEVRALADGGRLVAAIGHPASDDGALGAADVAVALGAAGAAPGEWGVALASDDVRDAALALTVPRACRDRAKKAALVAAGAQGFVLLGVGFGAAPPAIVPIVAVIAGAVALAIVREPAVLPDGR